MKRFVIGLLLTIINASLAAGQELADVPDLKGGLSAIRAQALALKSTPTREPIGSAEGSHRLGHSLQHLSLGPGLVELAVKADISAYPVHGIDVSHYEKDIQWDKVKAGGISFAFIKATEGAGYIDPAFLSNWKAASSAGLAKGAYHFYNFCKTGAEQADNFLKTVPVEAGALPMVIDLEQSEDCAKMPSKEAFLKDLAAFVAKVKTAYGLTPILYINLSIYDQYLSGAGGSESSAGACRTDFLTAGANDSYKLWIADISHQAPKMPAGTSWTFWQYGWHGTVAGISSEVDLDVFNGDAQALSLLAKP